MTTLPGTNPPCDQGPARGAVRNPVLTVITVGGTPNPTDIVSVTINNNANGALMVSTTIPYTVQSGDTNATIAAALASLIISTLPVKTNITAVAAGSLLNIISGYLPGTMICTTLGTVNTTLTVTTACTDVIK